VLNFQSSSDSLTCSLVQVTRIPNLAGHAVSGRSSWRSQAQVLPVSLQKEPEQ
jgi:hypothetical protein